MTPRRPRAHLLFQNLAAHADGVADEDRAAEHPVADAQESERAHGRGIQAQAAADRPDEQTMRDRPPIRGGFGEFMIHVDRD